MRNVVEWPVGVHKIVSADDHLEGYFAVRPPIPQPLRGWGLNVFARAICTEQSWGIGDFRDVRQVGQDLRRLGAQFLSLLPTVAAQWWNPDPASPYSAISRQFQDPLHIHVPQAPGWVPPADEAELGREVDRLRSTDLVDLEAVRRLKNRELRRAFSCHRNRPSDERWRQFEKFEAEMGPELVMFGRYCAIAEKHGADWMRWRDVEVQRADPEEVRFHSWCQYLLDDQLAQAAASIDLVRDLPVGSPLASFDIWRWSEAAELDSRLGAPADYFNTDGHNWGLVPFHPGRLRRLGYEPLRAAIRATLRHAKAIRVDHAYGLFRQWWIPSDGLPKDGRYVAQDATALTDIISIEAHSRGATVISEELGTPPPEGLQALRSSGFLRLNVLTSEEFDPTDSWCALTTTTHDLPTISRLLHDLTDNRKQRTASSGRDDALARAMRLARRPDIGGADTLTEATYEAIAKSDAPVKIVPLEDALRSLTPMNLPGIEAAANFRVRYPGWAETLASDGTLRRIFDAMSGSSLDAPRASSAYRYPDQGDVIPLIGRRGSNLGSPESPPEQGALEAARSLIDHGRRIRALDIGCGTGRLLPVLGGLADDVIAFDADETRAMASCELVERLGLGNCSVVLGTIDTAPMPPGTFDLVNCSHVLQHIPLTDRAHLLNAIRTRTSPDGAIVVVVPVASDADRHLVSVLTDGEVRSTLITESTFEALCAQGAAAGLPVWQPTLEHLVELIRSAGLEVVRSIPVNEFKFSVTLGHRMELPAVDTAVICRVAP